LGFFDKFFNKDIDELGVDEILKEAEELEKMEKKKIEENINKKSNKDEVKDKKGSSSENISNKIKNLFKKKEKEEEYDVTIDDIKKRRNKVVSSILIKMVFMFFILMAILAAIILFTSQGKKAPKRVALQTEENTSLNVNDNYNLWKLQTNLKINQLEKSIQKTNKEVKKELNVTVQTLTKTVNEIKKDILNKIEEQNNQVNSKINNLLQIFDMKLNNQKQELISLINSKVEKVNSKIKNQPTAIEVPELPPLNEEKPIKKPSKIQKKVNQPKLITTPKLTKEEKLKKIQEEYSQTAPVVITTEKDVDTEKLYKQNYENNNTNTKKQDTPYSLMTGLVKGTLLTGVSAPTFSQGLKNPKPVLISVDSKELIANNQQINIKNCLLIGIATGNINSARAEIKITRISCTIPTNNGFYYKLEAAGNPIGWVIGEDGKYGLKGRLVDSAGKVLMRQLMVGFLQGVANAFSPRTTVVIPTGTTNTVTPGGVLKSGAVNGVNTALNSLAQYYQKMLEGLYPFIDVMAGRKVTVFIKGFQNVKFQKYKPVNVEPTYNGDNGEEVIIVNENDF